MKKIVTFLSFLFILSQTLHAQGEFRFGFQASPSFSWIGTNSNQVNSDGVRLGFKLGVLGEYYFQENYALVGGLGFAFGQGGTLTQELPGTFWAQSEHASSESPLVAGTSLKHSLQFIEIPAAFKMTTRYFGSLRYYAEIPQITIGIKTQSRGALNGTIDTTMTSSMEEILDVDESKIDIKKEIAPLNISLGLGLGAEYEISESTSLVAGIFYQQGILDLTDDKSHLVLKDGSSTLEEEDSKGTLRAITLRIGVMF